MSKRNIRKKLSEKGMSLKGVYKFTLVDHVTGERIEKVYENIVPTVGRAAIATHLTNPSPSTPLFIKYAALGSGTTAPANSDVKLQTETYRNLIASHTSANNIAFATAFFTQTEVTGTFKEAGIFIGGTGTADSGTLLSHVPIDITKTSTQSLTLDWTLSIL